MNLGWCVKGVLRIAGFAYYLLTLVSTAAKVFAG